MWKYLNEKEKRHYCINHVKKNTLKKVMIEQGIDCLFISLAIIIIGVLSLCPGRYSGNRSVPTYEDFFNRLIICFIISFVITTISFLYSYISYFIVSKDKKVQKCYKYNFTGSDMLCIKCSKAYKKKIITCPTCANLLVCRKDYIWIGK